MTLYEFNVLSLETKKETVSKHRTFLYNYITKDIRIKCYAIDRFFVEVIYDDEHNKITEVRSFRAGDSLDKLMLHFNTEI